MDRWTRVILRHRWPVLAAWAVALVLGGYGFSKLSALQSNTFSVPGTDSERVRTILSQRFGDRSDGSFTVVFQGPSVSDPNVQARLQSLVDRAAHAVPTGRGTALRLGSATVLYGDVVSRLNLAKAKGYAGGLLRALGSPAGVRTYVTGPAAIQHDLDPIFSADLKRGEAIALPIALLVLLAVFGLSGSVTIPFLFAGSTIFATLGFVYVIAHVLTMPTYVTNLVFLIGLGIAIDYSLLIVYRFREELGRGLEKDAAIIRTMETAGRAVLVSGATVAIGLGMLLFFPLPFIRAIGIGGFLIPLVSLAAAATLQPALLSVYGVRGTRRLHVADYLRRRLHLALPRMPGTEDVERGYWARLARSIMRRPVAYLVTGTALLLAAAVPVVFLQLTPGSAEGIPRYPQSVRGFDALRAAVGSGAISPTQVLVDAGEDGQVRSRPVQAAIASLVQRIRRDPETEGVFYASGGRFVDPGGRYAQVIVAGRHEYGDEASQAFARRLRSSIVPSVSWPEGTRALVGGAPPQGVDFLDRAYSTFPLLVLAVLALTYLLLLRAFRSLLLPLKAVLMNLLSIAAAYGILVVVFRWGVGKDTIGLYQYPQVEGWIPIFLFAMLFGLSMDYEVFLVSRMRESWDELRDNERAVAVGLERTGRIITAAAAIMIAAFSGFLAGRIVGLQEFGLGLGVAIFVDATIVRALLVPAVMAIMGRWNWWLPEGVARVARVSPSPLTDSRPRRARRRSMRIAPAVFAAACGALLAVPAASASTSVRYGIQDDAWLEFGPGTLEQRLTTFESLGVPFVRFTLRWDQVAPVRPADAASPGDPAYNWRLPDSILQGLRAHGLTAIVTLLGTPPWANGGKAANYAPARAADFAAFARAAATRYSWVRYWLVWNEPNQRRWLRPTSAGVYVSRLLNPAYAAIHAEIPGAKVGGGVTAPRAGPGGVAPVTWILAMGAAGARLDAYAQHPYPSSPAETPFAGGCRNCRTITMATLGRLVATVTRAFGPKRIWLTEYGYQTRPPDPFGVSPARQAAYIGQAALRAYEELRVDMLIQYLYRDEPTLDRFQSGLVYKNNVAKPSLLAFRLPFAEKRRSGLRTVVWGQLRAGGGRRPYRLQQLRGGRWQSVGGTSLTGAGGFFTRTVRAAPGALLRVWSPSQQLAGLPLRIS